MSRIDALLHHYCPSGVLKYKLGEIEDKGILTLGRGQVISKIDMAATAGDYPVYSSSSQGNGEIGRYGKYMFDDERLTWSIDGGGRFFYRNNHKYSVTNVCGWLKVNDDSVASTKYLFYVLSELWSKKVFDYTHKAHPSVIRNEYLVPLPPIAIQKEIVRILDSFTDLEDNLQQELEARIKQYGLFRENMLKLSSFEGNVELVRLGDCCTMKKGEYITQKGSEVGTIPVILGGQEPAYYINKYNHIGEVIVISRSGASAGFVSFWNEPIFATDGFMIEAGGSNSTRYIYHCLKSHQDELNSMKRGSGVPHITGGMVMDFLIPLPSHEEQTRIVSTLDTFEEYINNLSSELLSRQKQYEYYRKLLLTF